MTNVSIPQTFPPKDAGQATYPEQSRMAQTRPVMATDRPILGSSSTVCRLGKIEATHGAGAGSGTRPNISSDALDRELANMQPRVTHDVWDTWLLRWIDSPTAVISVVVALFVLNCINAVFW